MVHKLLGSTVTIDISKEISIQLEVFHMEAYLVVFDSCRLSHSLFRDNGRDFSNRWETKKGNLGFFCGCGAHTRRCNPRFPIRKMK